MIFLWSGCEMDVNVEDEERHAALIKSRGPHQVGKNTFTSNLYIHIWVYIYIYIYLKINNIKHIICDKLAVIYIYILMVSGFLTTSQPLHRTTAPAAFGWDPWSPMGRFSGRRATDRSSPNGQRWRGAIFSKKTGSIGEKTEKIMETYSGSFI